MYSTFKFSEFDGNISDWDVSKVRTMDYMFYHSKFNQDISSWRIKRKNKMKIFEQCPIDEYNMPLDYTPSINIY